MIAKKFIDRTFLRTEPTMNLYIQRIADIRNGKKKAFDNFDEIKIKEFKYWAILPNEFPYDAIAEVNHLLFTKRKIPLGWDNLTKDELKELDFLKKTYLPKHYDVLYENFPKSQSIPGHFHLQLLKIKREKIEI